ncbi:MAG: thioredoxin domain-containing protein [Desulfobacteraceae bacterium]|nr:thioredoxin domain-containing protein [Desulfobacteraceae bacterium]
MTVSSATNSNRLINEKSPYLRQHADNPVDWFAWGDAAFEKAGKENKPVLVSIGYATCHWCHVMADESFSDPETARIMNENLVSIKIDREERPDLDQIYITAVSALTGSAGWPLNVFLTPEAKPFFGGTYFPTRQRFGMASWKQVVESVGRAWQDPEQRQKLLTSAENITAAVKAHLQDMEAGAGQNRPDKTLLDAAAAGFAENYDPEAGGFSRAPKFPMPAVLRFLLFYYRCLRFDNERAPNGQRSLDMAVHTLSQISRGGIYDHLGGGFHRYATDNAWHVPHFEKMLYDNAQMIPVLLEAYEITGDSRFANIAVQTLDYIHRDMTHEQGGFYSAEDADSYPLDLSGPDSSAPGGHKAEGAFYVWKKSEIDSILDKDESEIFCRCYGVGENGNVRADPSGEFSGKNILYEARSIGQVARETGMDEKTVGSLVRQAAEKLRTVRNHRPRPFRDEKILVEWNALMISALVKASRILGDAAYLDRARKAVDFILTRMVSQDGRLYRRWADGQRAVFAMAGDYAMLVQALLDLYEHGLDPVYLREARQMGAVMLELFFDDKQGGFFMTAADQDKYLIMRPRDLTDNVIPAANSVAAQNCVRLFRITDEKRFYEAAQKTFQASEKRLRQNPQSAPRLLSALGRFLEIQEDSVDAPS